MWKAILVVGVNIAAVIYSISHEADKKKSQKRLGKRTMTVFRGAGDDPASDIASIVEGTPRVEWMDDLWYPVRMKINGRTLDLITATPTRLIARDEESQGIFTIPWKGVREVLVFVE